MIMPQAQGNNPFNYTKESEMAEFCKQCASTLFGNEPEFNDGLGLVTEEQVKLGLAANFLCEGCGPTQVDHTGSCVTDCMEHHNVDNTKEPQP